MIIMIVIMIMITMIITITIMYDYDYYSATIVTTITFFTIIIMIDFLSYHDNYYYCSTTNTNCFNIADLNLGCPQPIAKHRQVGAFLADDMERVADMVKRASAVIKVIVFSGSGGRAVCSVIG